MESSKELKGDGKRASGTGISNTHRRTWDKDAFAERELAKLEEEEQEEANKNKKRKIAREVVERKHLELGHGERSTAGVFDFEAKLGQKHLISTTTKESAQGGFYCDTCECLLRDSSTWLDHLNGKKHQKNLGMNMRVERASVDQVRNKLSKLKKPVAQRSAAANATAYAGQAPSKALAAEAVAEEKAAGEGKGPAAPAVGSVAALAELCAAREAEDAERKRVRKEERKKRKAAAKAAAAGLPVPVEAAPAAAAAAAAPAAAAAAGEADAGDGVVAAIVAARKAGDHSIAGGGGNGYVAAAAGGGDADGRSSKWDQAPGGGLEIFTGTAESAAAAVSSAADDEDAQMRAMMGLPATGFGGGARAANNNI